MKNNKNEKPKAVPVHPLLSGVKKEVRSCETKPADDLSDTIVFAVIIYGAAFAFFAHFREAHLPNFWVLGLWGVLVMFAVPVVAPVLFYLSRHLAHRIYKMPEGQERTRRERAFQTRRAISVILFCVSMLSGFVLVVIDIYLTASYGLGVEQSPLTLRLLSHASFFLAFFVYPFFGDDLATRFWRKEVPTNG